MQVTCGDAKFVIENGKILHVFNDEVLESYDTRKTPDLFKWVNDRMPKHYKRESPPNPRKWVTFKICAKGIGISYEQLLTALMSKNLVSIKKLANGIDVIIPSEEALRAGIACHKKNNMQFLWNQFITKDFLK